MSNSGAPLLQVVITEEDAGDRLDRFLARYCDSLSRSRIQSLIEIGSVQVGGSHPRASYRVKNGDHIDINIPEPTKLDITPENIPLTVPYEDNDLLIIDKGPGMTVHPAPGNWSGTLVNALLHRCDDLSGINGILRPGIVHRLDRDTTGLMIVAKTDVAHRHLAAQLEARTVKRTYSAIVWGHPDEGRIEAPLGRHTKDRMKMTVREDGRHAITHFLTHENFQFLSLLEIKLETGRTHQIRVHMQHHGHPVFGDKLYGGRTRSRGIAPNHRKFAEDLLALIQRQALHAIRLEFEHPRTGKIMAFEGELANDMTNVLNQLRNSH